MKRYYSYQSSVRLTIGNGMEKKARPVVVVVVVVERKREQHARG